MHAQIGGKRGLGKTKATYSNPFRLLLIVAVSVFIAEALIMSLFSWINFMTKIQEAAFDAILLLMLIIPVLYLFFYKPFLLDIKEREKAEKEKNEAIEKLEKAIDEIKVLKGFLPICFNCKNIKDDAGYWQQVETYLRDHSDIEFSHGLCPDCAKKLYPEYW